MGAYLVTGGAGFIGSHIVDRLVEAGESVRVIDNFSSGKIQNIEHNLDKIELVKGDIVDMPTVKNAMDGMDYVIHHAAIASVPSSVDDPIGSNDAGVVGTLNLLVAARDAAVKRMVYASSSAIYGDAPESPKIESMSPSLLSPYALTKLTGEYYCRLFTDLYGLETVCLRYFNVFGPRQDPESAYAAVIPKFVQRITNGLAPHVHGDGLQSRDFTYVENVVSANMLACHAPKQAAGQVCNIACGESISLIELIETLNEVLGTSIAPEFGPVRQGDVKYSSADITKARTLLGFSPCIGFKEGLQKMLS